MGQPAVRNREGSKSGEEEHSPFSVCLAETEDPYAR